MPIRRCRQALTIFSSLLCLGAATALSQCRPPRDSHEAKLLAFYSVPTVFSADAQTIALPTGSVRIAIEGAYVPTAPATLQRTEFCYTGRAENTGLTSFFGRPRIAVSLPRGFGFEASYLPPITVAHATPDLASAALWFTRPVNASIVLSARVHATVGVVKGPITCPRSALQQANPEDPCYGTKPSTDGFRPDMTGLEFIASTNPAAADKVRFSAGVGMNQLFPRFRVGFSDLNGGTDHTRIAVNLIRFTGLVGASIRLSQRCDAATQVYSSVADATTLRATFGCLLRH